MKTNRSHSRIVVMQLLLIAIVSVSLASTSVWAGKGNGSGVNTLLEPEAEMLTFMREEEKLARDVYIEMFEQWDAVIFTNIVDSEQKHMDTMKKMIDKYGLPDPVLPGLGQFYNQDLQQKYDDVHRSLLSRAGGMPAAHTSVGGGAAQSQPPDPHDRCLDER